MRTVADPEDVRSLKARLEMLRPDSARRWGTMTPQEMLCHLGDSPMLNPKVDGTQPSEFAKDLARAIAGIDGIATARPGALEPVHGVLGTMTLRDWQRWAYRHTHHHLRQFGL